ncbi:MAG: AraC family transcriptional regulator [Lentisphaerae bacterium]|nr:AraC family transcriptional regulator [Lentisphaerota bacterium]MBQ4328320.1 helix-turn-helix transcriptional regulator [Lentisphaeria bacterium]
METSRSRNFFWGPDRSFSLYVRSYGDFILVPPDTEARRTVDFGEIFWPVSGQCKFRMDGREYVVKPGYLWYYPPDSHHDYNPVTTFHYCWLTVAGKNAGHFFDMLNITPGMNRAGHCPEQLFAQLGNDLSYHTPKHRINALTTAFRIAAMASYMPRTQNNSDPSMEDAKNLIDTTYDDPDLSVTQLAEYLDMHRGSLSRAFRKAFDMTVSDYIIFVRLNNARKMLENPAYPIKEVAEACGFGSANYFTKVFAGHSGITPQKYRKQLIPRTEE